ncbi:MAG: ubiquinol-cytochrome c reductase iron-sulfur subunit [Chloroflexi bacterium]|nr:ubiquinol-cytochrome c reductase iron-sulfur subunit [Chloroflexota bacterium]
MKMIDNGNELPKVTNTSDLDMPESSPNLPRRRFLAWGIYGIGAVVTMVLTILSVGYFIAPVVGAASELEVPVGEVTEFNNLNVPKAIELNYQFTDSFKQITGTAQIYVAALRKGANTAEDFKIFSPICTHLGCMVPWVEAENQFHCPCHGSTFTAEGVVTKGPASRNFDQYKLAIKDGKLVINPLQTFTV